MLVKKVIQSSHFIRSGFDIKKLSGTAPEQKTLVLLYSKTI